MFKRFILFTVFVAICAIVFGSCSKSSDKLAPLAVGNYWEFQRVWFDTLGKESHIDTVRITVNDQIDISGTTVYSWSWDFYSSHSILLTNMSDGVYVFGYVQDGVQTLYDAPSLWLKYPGKVGEEFYAKSDDVTYKIASISSIISVPAGEFTCYEYRGTAPEFGGDVVTYFSPQIGYIAQKVSLGGTPQYEFRLVDYKITPNS